VLVDLDAEVKDLVEKGHQLFMMTGVILEEQK